MKAEEIAHLPDGLVCRRASRDEALQAADLNGERNGTGAGVDCRRLIDDPRCGPGVFTVVLDGDRVVSTLCLLAETFELGGVQIPVGRPEYVCTHAGYTGRGLIRAQMAIVHEWSRARGDLLQIITGIDYFYRQFGYEYAVDIPHALEIASVGGLEVPDGWEVRDAQPVDAEAVTRLQDEQQARCELVCRRDERAWAVQIGTVQDPWRCLSLVRDGRVEGFARQRTGSDGPARLQAAVVSGPEAAAALLTLFGKQGPLLVFDRSESVLSRVAAPFVSSTRPSGSLYVRVPDPAALLDRLRPVLSERLRSSAFAEQSGSLLVSLYRRSVTLSYSGGEVTSVEPGPGEQSPVDRGGIGVPPDLVATLVLGRYGAREMASRYTDVALGDRTALAEVLFPKVSSDLLLFT